MGTNCAPLVADLFLFCYERDFMMSLSDDKQAEVIDAFNTTSRYLDDILNINYVYFDYMVSQIYPSELQLNTQSSLYSCTPDRGLSMFTHMRKFYLDTRTNRWEKRKSPFTNFSITVLANPLSISYTGVPV